MAHYFIGDIQGCHAPFQRLLETVDFSPSRDTLFLLGDLVNRGPDSAAVLRQCMNWGDAVQAVLGNHDLHLLASAYGLRRHSRKDTLDNVLQAPDCPALLDWLRQQPLARVWTDQNAQRILMVHAGVLPSWTVQDAIVLSQEVQNVLSGPEISQFLSVMYGNMPNYWSDDWQGNDRIRAIVNAMTRLRFCTPQGHIDFDSAESAHQAPEGLVPWFDCPNRKTQKDIIAFGHWSTLGLINQSHLMALDTGCVWGGSLTAVRIENNALQREVIQVPCEGYQNPS